MIEKTRNDISDNHPIRALFQQLTERGMGQLHMHDPETIQYITNLLTEFVQIENMHRATDESGQRVQYLFDTLAQASNEMSPELRRDYYKHLGDLTLFNLGLFPESLTYGHRTVESGLLCRDRPAIVHDRRGDGRVVPHPHLPEALRTIPTMRCRLELGKTLYQRSVLSVHVPAVRYHVIQCSSHGEE